jgi:hypothetical protein
MVNPIIIKIVYWVGIALAVLYGLGIIISGIGSGICVLFGLLTVTV